MAMTFHHSSPQGNTLTIENSNIPGRPRVIVDDATGRLASDQSGNEMTIKSEIKQLIERFVCGIDISIEAANEIEGPSRRLSGR